MPFDTHDLESYLQTHALSECSKEFIREAAVGVSRNVGTTSYPSMVTEHQSPKMGVSVATESSTGELAYAIQLDLDAEVVAYYEQLPPIDCRRTDKNGRAVTRALRSDFLVLRIDGPQVIDVKAESHALEKIEKYPSDWIMRDGRPVDLPAETAFAKIDLPHALVLDTDLPRIRTENLKTLLRVSMTPVTWSQDVIEQVRDILRSATAKRLSELATELGLVDQTPLLRMILDQQVFADLDRQLLTDAQSCWVSDSPVLLDLLIKEHAAENTASSSREASTALVPSRAMADASLKRLGDLRDRPNSRSARRWRAILRSRPKLSPFLALLDDREHKGNRLPKRPADVISFAIASVEKHWANRKRPSMFNAYRLYVAAAGKQHPGKKPVCLATFTKLANSRRQACAAARGGLRMANAVAGPSNVKDRALKPTRPFEAAAVDHCLLKIYCELLRTDEKIYVCRPWLTVLRDLLSHDALAWWLSFTHPSRTSFAMIVRSCAKRYGRLPETLMVDRGPEFRSVYTSALCAHVGMDLSIHPTSHARFGSEIERLFGIYSSRWLDMRPGNRTDVRNLRSISGTHHPSKMPCLILPELLRETSEFMEWFGTYCPTSLMQTPSTLLRDGLERYPFSGISVNYDDALVIATAIDAGRHKVDPTRGIQVGPTHFTNPELLDYAGRRLEVRRDPENHGCIYARTSGRWITCRATRSAILEAMDPNFRLAESLLVMDSHEAMNEMKRDADSALIGILAAADKRFAERRSSSAKIDVEVAEDALPDLWAQVGDSAIRGFTTSQWETGT